ncbi:MAG: M48 family metalloprotease [Hylemonella sp.]
MRRLLTLLLALLLALPTGRAQQNLPALGDGLELSLAAERKLGDRIARELYRSPDYLDDAVLQAYVQGIWDRLLQAAQQRGELSAEMRQRYAWDVLLGRDATVNAFALPGGYIGVHLGLIAAVENEDELASVLAHELSHVTQRHIARMIGRQNNQAPWLLGAMILGALAAGSNPNAAGALIVGGQAAAVQGQLNFSRDMEREADRVGYGVMTEAGYAGQGFVTMFEKLQQANRHNDTGAFPYLRSHPLTTERIADMQARQQLLPAAPVHTTMLHAMLAARARVLARPEVDHLRAAAGQADAADTATLAAIAQAGVLYGATLAAMQLREYERAQRALLRLRALTQGDAQAAVQWRWLAAELAQARGRPEEVLQLLDGLPAAPDALATRPTLLLRAAARVDSGQARQAAESLQVWLAAHPRDALAWLALARAYAAQGLAVQAIRAEAEAAAARLDYPAARDRLQAAQARIQQGAAIDHIEASIIDSRRREIESLLREQALER